MFLFRLCLFVCDLLLCLLFIRSLASGDGSPGIYACNSVCVVCLTHVSGAASAGPHFHHCSAGLCRSGGRTISSDLVCCSKEIMLRYAVGCEAKHCTEDSL